MPPPHLALCSEAFAHPPVLAHVLTFSLVSGPALLFLLSVPHPTGDLLQVPCLQGHSATVPGYCGADAAARAGSEEPCLLPQVGVMLRAHGQLQGHKAGPGVGGPGHPAWPPTVPQAKQTLSLCLGLLSYQRLGETAPWDFCPLVSGCQRGFDPQRVTLLK